VALASEGAELREAGIDAPILVLSEQPVDAVDDIVRFRLMATVYTVPFIDALAAAARDRGVDGVPVHLKIDTGMQRVGARTGCRRRAGRGARRASAGASPRRRVHPSRDGGSPRRRLHRRPAGAPRRHPGRPVVAGTGSSSTPPTRPAPWRIRPLGARSCAPGSRSTGSRRARRGPAVSIAPPGVVAEGAGVVRQAGLGRQRDLLRAAAHVRARHDGGDRADRVRRRGASAPVRGRR
jgi:hypothetical protein